MDFTFWKEFGITGLIMGSVVALLFLVIKWTLATTKDILAQNAKQVDAFNDLQKSWITALNDHTIQARSFHDEVKQAHIFQREEHQKLAENQNTVCSSLHQVEQALGRINGYTH